jgi:hypothetical protein
MIFDAARSHDGRNVMKRSLTLSFAITFWLLVGGAISLESELPTKVLMLPGVLAEFELASIMSTGTLGLGGLTGMAVNLAVSGVVWFPVIFTFVAIYRRIFRHSVESCGGTKT